MLKASLKVVGSLTVGPEPITSSLSSITSESIKVTILPFPWVASRKAWANLPPLIWERCLRTQFNSLMEAEDAERSEVTFCLSSRETPRLGKGIRAEPPPEIKAISKSPSFASWASSSIKFEPSTALTVG